MRSEWRTVALASVAGLVCYAPVAWAETPDGEPMYPGVDVIDYPSTIEGEEARAYFDQGLVLAFGFNHDEAERSFLKAAELDPTDPLPWWGASMVVGMNINDPAMTEERWEKGYEYAREAAKRLDGATDKEKLLVAAVQARYAWPAPEEQKPYDEAYAAAMQEVYEYDPADLDMATIYVESLLDLQPWDYWTVQKEPKGRITEATGILEAVLEADPDHPHAAHLYIHAMEAGPTPEKAVPYAERLENRVPGAGHLVHMPSHIYARVGRYGDAADTNVRAVAVDRAYMQLAPQPGIYYIYYMHNLHFQAYASMMEGRFDPAWEAALAMENEMPEDVLREVAPLIEGIMPTKYHVLIRFGRWEEILELSPPPEWRSVSYAVHFYARGIAYSALGRPEEAKAEIAKFELAVAETPEDWYVFNNRVHDVLPIARGMLAGELAYREGRYDDAWAALDAAIEAEDQLIYDEPPAWMLPVRHAMGALLMGADQPAWAERLYLEDQERHPGNMWSLVGLRNAYEAQGKDEQAAAVEAQLDTAWRRVEAKPTSSCLCEPAKKGS